MHPAWFIVIPEQADTGRRADTRDQAAAPVQEVRMIVDAEELDALRQLVNTGVAKAAGILSEMAGS